MGGDARTGNQFGTRRSLQGGGRQSDDQEWRTTGDQFPEEAQFTLGERWRVGHGFGGVGVRQMA